MKKLLHALPKEEKEDLGIIGGLFVIASFILIMSLYVIPPFARALESIGVIHKYNYISSVNK